MRTGSLAEPPRGGGGRLKGPDEGPAGGTVTAGARTFRRERPLLAQKPGEGRRRPGSRRKAPREVMDQGHLRSACSGTEVVQEVQTQGTQPGAARGLGAVGGRQG